MSKVLIIGLDGTTLDLILPWAAQGKLPVLNRLLQQGMHGRLRSVTPTLSPPAWTSFMTGVNPGKHGIFDFVYRDPSSYNLRPVQRQHIQSPSLWHTLGQNGHKVVVMNVPLTYPPEKVNGVLISGLGTPDYRTYTFPPELGKELSDRGYRVNRRVHFHTGDEEAYLQEVYEIARHQFDCACFLMDDIDWDFFMTVFYDTDQLAGYFWHHMDASHPRHDSARSPGFANAILEFHQQMDTYIGKLIDKAGSNTDVFIVSDHGAGPFYKDEFLNEWLRINNFLSLNGETAQLSPVRRNIARLGITRENISAGLKATGLHGLEPLIKRALGEHINILPRRQQAEFPYGINWPQTRAYSFGYQGQIFINLEGREPQGIVKPGKEYDQVCEEITCRIAGAQRPRRW